MQPNHPLVVLYRIKNDENTAYPNAFMYLSP